MHTAASPLDERLGPQRRRRRAPLRWAVQLAFAALSTGCAVGTGSPSVEIGNHGTPRLYANERCFDLGELTEEERSMADSLVARALDNEALFTFAGPLKPMSTVTDLRLPILPDPLPPPGTREVVRDRASQLEHMARVVRVAEALECHHIEVIVVPFRLAWDSVRTLAVSVVHRGLLDHVLERDQPFWGKWGLVPGADPATLAAVVEYESALDRFRGYGYLFGYPDHAVTFFVEAAREAERTGEMVPRDFFQIPVHSALEGRFVYAVPRGHTPVADDLDLLREAADILSEYRTRRPHYVNEDGTLRAVDLIRDWTMRR